MNVPETFFSVREELTLFGLSCLAGAAIGLCYDALRALRTAVRHGIWLTALEDIGVLGNALGFTLYYFTLGSVIIRLFGKLYGALAALLRLLTAPLRRLYVLLRKKAGVKFVGSSKILHKINKILKLLLPNRIILRYNKMENKKRKNVNNVAKKN